MSAAGMSPMNYEDLTLKQRSFIDNYLIDFNATAAAKRAGYSTRTAGAIGHENLKKPEIRRVIDERVAEIARFSREQITASLVAFATGARCPDSGLALKALELLGRSQKMFTDNVNLNADVEVKGYQNVSPDDWDSADVRENE